MNALELRILSQVIGVFPHSKQHVVDLPSDCTLDEGKWLATEFSISKHTARVDFTLEKRSSGGTWSEVAVYSNGEEIPCVQLETPYKHTLLSIIDL